MTRPEIWKRPLRWYVLAATLVALLPGLPWRSVLHAICANRKHARRTAAAPSSIYVAFIVPRRAAYRNHATARFGVHATVRRIRRLTLP